MEISNASNITGRPLTPDVTSHLDNAVIRDKYSGKIEKRGLAPSMQSKLELSILNKNSAFAKDAEILRPYDGAISYAGSKKDGNIDFAEYSKYKSDLELEKMVDYNSDKLLSTQEEATLKEIKANSELANKNMFTLGNITFYTHNKKPFNVTKNETGDIFLKTSENLYKMQSLPDGQKARFSLYDNSAEAYDGLKFTKEKITEDKK